VITTGHRFKRLVRDRSQTAHRTSCARKKSSKRPDLFPDASSWVM
jgi:hypothetical protein